MKIMCMKTSLQKGLETVSGIIESRTSIPILNNILLETLDHKTLKISATNLELGIECFVDADITKQGTITIPGKKFASVVKELTDEIQIETNRDNIFVKSGKADLRIVGMPRDEFPRINVNTDFVVTISQKNMKEILEKTSFSMSTDDTRYILKGVYLSLDQEYLISVATDGKRLSYIKTEIENSSGAKKKVVIPAASVTELKRILGDKGDVKIAIDDTHVTFICDSIHVVSKIIEGNYPDNEQVIPKKTNVQITLQKDEMLNILKRATYFTSEDNRRIHIKINKEGIWIKAKSVEFGEFEEKIDGIANIDKFDIAFSMEFLIQVVKHLDQEKITFEMNAPDKAVVIKEGMNQLYLIMPMKMADNDE